MAESERDPRTVFVAENSRLADAVVQLLAAQGITAESYSPPPRTDSEPIMGMTEVTRPDEIEIRVTDPTRAEDARELLASAESTAAVRAVREKRAARTGSVTAVCEECGKSSEWPAEVMGTTETCPHCDAYMDIPDPDDDWSGVDFGEDEEERSE